MRWKRPKVSELAVIAGIAIVLFALMYSQPQAAVKSSAISRLKLAFANECEQLSWEELSKLDRPAQKQFVNSHALEATFGSLSGEPTAAYFAVLPLAFLGHPEEFPYTAVLVPCEETRDDIADYLEAPGSLKTLDKEIRQRYADLEIAPIVYERGTGAISLDPDKPLFANSSSYDKSDINTDRENANETSSPK